MFLRVTFEQTVQIVAAAKPQQHFAIVFVYVCGILCVNAADERARAEAAGSLEMC